MALVDELSYAETYEVIDAKLATVDNLSSLDEILEELDLIEFDDLLDAELEDLPHDPLAEPCEGLDDLSDVLSLGFDNLPGLSIDDGDFLQAIQQEYDESDDHNGDYYETCGDSWALGQPPKGELLELHHAETTTTTPMRLL